MRELIFHPFGCVIKSLTIANMIDEVMCSVEVYYNYINIYSLNY